jgi:hypothetical protein
MNSTLAPILATASGQMGDVTMTIQVDENGQCRETYSIEGAIITIDAPLSELGHEAALWLVDRLPFARHGLALMLKEDREDRQ